MLHSVIKKFQEKNKAYEKNIHPARFDSNAHWMQAIFADQLG
jgi:hypothetical protein